MKTGPLNESELEWLDEILSKYATEGAILDVSDPGRAKSNQRNGCLLSGAGRIMYRAGLTIASATVSLT